MNLKTGVSLTEEQVCAVAIPEGDLTYFSIYLLKQKYSVNLSRARKLSTSFRDLTVSYGGYWFKKKNAY